MVYDFSANEIFEMAIRIKKTEHVFIAQQPNSSLMKKTAPSWKNSQ